MREIWTEFLGPAFRLAQPRLRPFGEGSQKKSGLCVHLQNKHFNRVGLKKGTRTTTTKKYGNQSSCSHRLSLCPETGWEWKAKLPTAPGNRRLAVRPGLAGLASPNAKVLLWAVKGRLTDMSGSHRKRGGLARNVRCLIKWCFLTTMKLKGETNSGKLSGKSPNIRKLNSAVPNSLRVS